MQGNHPQSRRNDADFERTPDPFFSLSLSLSLSLSIAKPLWKEARPEKSSMADGRRGPIIGCSRDSCTSLGHPDISTVVRTPHPRDALTFWFLPYEVSHCEGDQFPLNIVRAVLLLRCGLKPVCQRASTALRLSTRYTRAFCRLNRVPLERDRAVFACYSCANSHHVRQGIGTSRTMKEETRNRDQPRPSRRGNRTRGICTFLGDLSKT